MTTTRFYCGTYETARRDPYGIRSFRTARARDAWVRASCDTNSCWTSPLTTEEAAALVDLASLHRIDDDAASGAFSADPYQR